MLVVIVLMGVGRLTEPAAHGRPDIALVAVGAVGLHPFTASVATAPPAAPAAHPATTAGSGSAPPAGGAQMITTTAGGQPGLYGGTRDTASCDGQRLLADLQQAPARTAAWAEVEGFAVGDLATFVGGLTGVVLRGDTRVTDHGFITDHPSIGQAVLEAGTAVMVDHFGIPRVRCLSGDPLTPPVAVTISPHYVGTRWPGFAPAAVTVVTAAAQPLLVLVLADAQGARFSRPVGTGGGADAPASAPAS